MSKEKKQTQTSVVGLVPELRFPEFKNDGEWGQRNLGEVGEFIGGGTPSTSNPEFWDGDILWYTPTEVKNGTLNASIRTITRTGLKNSSAKLLPIGAILITTRATIGDAAIALNQCATNQGFQSLVVKESENNQFWYYWIIYHKKELERRSSGSTFKEIGKNEIKIIPTLSPSIQEQQKIASCLSSLDELIAAHNEKLEALKDHKKGLMQNLFPQEGETIPKLRFPEFENDGEWVEKNLGEISEIVTGSTPKTNMREYYGGKIMFVSPSDISDKKFIDSTEKTLTVLGFDKTRKIRSNSVMFVCIGSTIGKVAMNRYDCATNQQINSLIPNEFTIGDFLYSILELNANIISGLAGKQAVPIINKTLFSSVVLKFPPTIQEQRKIASCLSAVDELITSQQGKFEQLQQHKKGLMQGLFPKVTG